MAVRMNLATYVDNLDLSTQEDMSKLTKLLSRNLFTDVSWGERVVSIHPHAGSILLEELANKICEASTAHWNALFKADPETHFRLPACQNEHLLVQDWINSLTILTLLKEQYAKTNHKRYCCLNQLLLWIYDFFNYTKQYLEEATQFLQVVTDKQSTLIQKHCRLDGEVLGQQCNLSTDSGTIAGYLLSARAVELLVKQNSLRAVS
jgi:hypothetical protein